MEPSPDDEVDIPGLRHALATILDEGSALIDTDWLLDLGPAEKRAEMAAELDPDGMHIASRVRSLGPGAWLLQVTASVPEGHKPLLVLTICNRAQWECLVETTQHALDQMRLQP